MTPDDVTAARRALHAVAEHLLAGPMHRTSGEIALRVTATGFATTDPPAPDLDVLELRFRGTVAELVTHARGDVVPVRGTARDLAERLGLDPGAPADLYPDHADLGLDDDLAAPADGVAVVVRAFADGARALSELAHAELQPEQVPVLWPEHFDVGITLDGVNYGVSPGDGGIAHPYAYVGPHTARAGSFWNVSFGAARPMSELRDAEGVLGFFREGRRLTDTP